MLKNLRKLTFLDNSTSMHLNIIRMKIRKVFELSYRNIIYSYVDMVTHLDADQITDNVIDDLFSTMSEISIENMIKNSKSDLCRLLLCICNAHIYTPLYFKLDNTYRRSA